MKKKMMLFAVPVLLLSLASCSKPTSQPTKTEPTNTTVAPTTTVLVENSDSDVESGEYIMGKLVYALDKTNKKITCTDYNGEYNKYVNKQGTKKFEAAVKFYNYNDYKAVCFETEDYICYLYKDSNNVYNLVKTSDGYLDRTSISKMPTLTNFTYGTYVSSELEGKKYDADGKTIYEDGKAVKVKYYLFLELTQTSAKIYIGDNNTTHNETPYLSVQNYVTYFNNGGLLLKLYFSSESEDHISLNRPTENTIHFSPSFSKNNTYESSGTFTKTE